MEKMLLKSTTRHVRIFTAEVVDEELKFHPNKLTLDLDPDNEFIWNKDSLKKINEKFNEFLWKQVQLRTLIFGEIRICSEKI